MTQIYFHSNPKERQCQSASPRGEALFRCARPAESRGAPPPPQDPSPLRLQYSCLENPRDGGAWWAAVEGSCEGGGAPPDSAGLAQRKRASPRGCIQTTSRQTYTMSNAIIYQQIGSTIKTEDMGVKQGTHHSMVSPPRQSLCSLKTTDGVQHPLFHPLVS